MGYQRRRFGKNRKTWKKQGQKPHRTDPEKQDSPQSGNGQRWRQLRRQQKEWRNLLDLYDVSGDH